MRLQSLCRSASSDQFNAHHSMLFSTAIYNVYPFNGQCSTVGKSYRTLCLTRGFQRANSIPIVNDYLDS